MIRRSIQNRATQASQASGFTLIEIMVAVVILAVGLLGMAMMTVMVIRGNRMAVKQTNCTTLAQQFMERIKDVDYDNLGADGVSCASPVRYGITNTICAETVNAQGLLPSVGVQGPFSYVRYLSVCDASSTASTIATPAADHCDDQATLDGADMTATAVSAELACSGNLNAGEKQVRIVCATRDPQRGCLEVGIDTVVVQSF